ncbi:hypothetical protein F5Y18DRAFT_262971 [Xylariaceae sp. FL1019]|nr:hypothetical protein F5Y18DRAFT_262971 [Xylariaceae sp. FL1019]
MAKKVKSRVISVRLLSMAMTGFFYQYARPRTARPMSMLKYDPVGTSARLPIEITNVSPPRLHRFPDAPQSFRHRSSKKSPVPRTEAERQINIPRGRCTISFRRKTEIFLDGTRSR